jgi:excisionase family DNA binding protein
MKLPERMRDILEMLTIDDVAKKLGVPATDVKVLIDTNQLSHYRLGQHGELVRIIRRDLIAFESKVHLPQRPKTDSKANA